MTVRTSFLAAADLAHRLISDPAVAGGWNDPSALDRMSVGELAAHLARSMTTVTGYLREPDAGIGEEMVDAAGYMLSIEGLSSTDGPNLDGELHSGIRQRAAVDAAAGPVAVVAAWEAAHDELTARLSAEPRTRTLRVFSGLRLMLDDYLVTRLVEMTIHSDDLAVSVGLSTPAFAAGTWDLVISCLTAVATRRHGHLAVARAMTRTERDDVNALRVL